MRQSKCEANVREEKSVNVIIFLFIYETCLTNNQSPLKLHERSRLKQY